MKTTGQRAVMWGLLLLAAGLLACLAAFAMLGFDISRVNTAAFVQNSYTVPQGFTRISVQGAECDVRLRLAEDGVCRVECIENDRVYHTVTVQDQTLVVRRQDDRKWYQHIGAFWGDMEVVIYLPAGTYRACDITTVSGDMEIPAGDWHFLNAKLTATSGDIQLGARVGDSLEIKTVSGDVQVSNVRPGDAQLHSTSGDVTLTGVYAAENIDVGTVSGKVSITQSSGQNISAATTSGNVMLTQVTAGQSLHIETTSGNVKLWQSDSAFISIKTVSGDVQGTLPGQKQFVVSTTSGRVEVPASVQGMYTCEVRTVSGDIRLEVEEAADAA